MLGLTTSRSRKLPIEDLAYTSESAGAGIEAEIRSSATSEEIRRRLKQLYAVLGSANRKHTPEP